MQYYSAIYRPSDHTVGRPRAYRFEPETGDLEAETLTSRPPTTPYYVSLLMIIYKKYFGFGFCRNIYAIDADPL